MKKVLPIVAVVVLLMLFAAPSASAAPPAWGPDCGGSYHCVRYGETLFSIGRLYNVDPYYIAEVNGLANPNYIYAGQVLYIPPTDGRPYPWWAHRPGRCDGCGYYQPPVSCGGCGYYGSYGYDQSGYYYGYHHPYKRYSYTCGYHYNCY
ncbi:LysM domain-containing protein [Candidatus Parcubacteria bacterium]|nr:MAG: LysM domain-containing protein [Candidatus Parcubacteria bacterium]